MIKVGMQGGETKDVEYREGMSAADAIKAIKYELRRGDTVSVNNVPARKPAKRGLNDDDIVVVTPNVGNG